MTRPTCPSCKGTKQVEAVSFRTAGATVKRSCMTCKGTGTLSYKVDIYDVIEWLESLPRHDEWYPHAVAAALETKWGASSTAERT